MDRRQFIATAAAAVVAPALPSPQAAPFVGVDLASGPDVSVTHLMWMQRDAVRELYRVTGIPRYRLGRDTWADQVAAGTADLVESEVT